MGWVFLVVYFPATDFLHKWDLHQHSCFRPLTSVAEVSKQSLENTTVNELQLQFGIHWPHGSLQKVNNVWIQAGHPENSFLIQFTKVQFWLFTSLWPPALENRCRTLKCLETHRRASVSPSCPIGLYHVLPKTLKVSLDQYIFHWWQPEAALVRMDWQSVMLLMLKIPSPKYREENGSSFKDNWSVSRN